MAVIAGSLYPPDSASTAASTSPASPRKSRVRSPACARCAAQRSQVPQRSKGGASPKKSRIARRRQPSDAEAKRRSASVDAWPPETRTRGR